MLAFRSLKTYPSLFIKKSPGYMVPLASDVPRKLSVIVGLFLSNRDLSHSYVH